MNPALVEQLMQLIEWGVSGLLNWKENTAYNDTYKPAILAALAANAPLPDDVWAQITADQQAAHAALQQA